MKNGHLCSFLLAGAFLLAGGCAKEPTMEITGDDDNNRIPLNIAGTIDQVATRATAEGFVDKDAVGLYAVNYLELACSQSITARTTQSRAHWRPKATRPTT